VRYGCHLFWGQLMGAYGMWGLRRPGAVQRPPVTLKDNALHCLTRNEVLGQVWPPFVSNFQGRVSDSVQASAVLRHNSAWPHIDLPCLFSGSLLSDIPGEDGRLPWSPPPVENVRVFKIEGPTFLKLNKGESLGVNCGSCHRLCHHICHPLYAIITVFEAMRRCASPEAD
jgi:hypothetical protein